MKKALLFLLCMLATVGMTMAQDVYSSGYYTTTGGVRNAAVYKNSEKLYEVTGVATHSHESRAVVIDPATNDVYWVDNCTLTSYNSFYFGKVYKNGEPYLDNPEGNGSHLYSLYWDPNTADHLFAAGCVIGSQTGKKYACVYREDETTPFLAPNFENGLESEALGLVRSHLDGVATTWYCGYVQDVDNSEATCATVWKDDAILWSLHANTRFYDLFIYDGSIYTIGTEEVDGHTIAKVWKNSSELYVLGDAVNDSRAWDITVDCGDVYVSGWGTVRSLCVWKNGEPLYTMDGSNLRGIDVNAEGVYYTVTQTGTTSSYVSFVYKDDSLLYAPDGCDYLYDLCVAPVECGQQDVRALPYFEGFEMGATDWSCWTVIDEEDNGGPAGILPLDSYWKRFSHDDSEQVLPATGNYCAFHSYNLDHPQEGWLISPQLFLQPGRSATTLSFDSYELHPDRMEYEEVWVSTTGTDPSDFTLVWSQDNPSEEWKTITIDLQPYQGYAVYIGFKYMDESGYNWYIDNFSVTEDWTPCESTLTVPFLEEFQNGMDECWYLIDSDQSGDLRCWQYDAANHCVTHPQGPENLSQLGWMFTPGFELASGERLALTFDTKSEGVGMDMKSSIWIATDWEGGVPDPSDYTMLWVEDEYDDEWQQRSIDLTAYAGHTVSFAFKYEGIMAHQWFIDNLAITEGVPQYNINVLSSNPAWGIATGGGVFEEGSICTIHAEPIGSYVFLKWTNDGGDVTTNPDYSFTVTGDATYTAVFGEPAVTYYTIDVVASPEEGGTVVGGDTYPAGTTIYLVALPNTGWHFVEWNDGVTDNPRAVEVNDNHTYTAVFLQNSCTLTVTASPTHGGNVTGNGTYLYGETVVLTATPNEGFDFLIWSDGVAQAVRTVTVREDAHYVAIFATSTTTLYTVTVRPNDPTLGVVVGGGVYPEGADVTISATPIGSAIFECWDDGNTKNPRPIKVTSDLSFVANFVVPEMFSIRAESLDPEMGTVSGSGVYPINTEVTLQATPFGGYYFVSWDDGSLDNPRTVTVTGDAAYWAKFSVIQPQTYQVSVTCNSDQGAVVGGGTYPAGATVTVQAFPFEEFVFDHWNDGNTENPRSFVVNEDVTLVALFIANDVNESFDTKVSLYPNPAKGSICFNGLENETEIMIYNSLGVLAKTVHASAHQEVNVADLSPGLYFARVRSSYLKFVVY